MTDDARARTATAVKATDVLLFMKGTPLFPPCAFFSRALAILDHPGVHSGSIPALQAPGVRQGIQDSPLLPPPPPALPTPPP